MCWSVRPSLFARVLELQESTHTVQLAIRHFKLLVSCVPSGLAEAMKWGLEGFLMAKCVGTPFT